MLGVLLPDNARVSVKKDGTINVRATDALGTRYEVAITTDGDVFRSRFCSKSALQLNRIATFAPKGFRRSCQRMTNCREYAYREMKIKDKKLLDRVRFFIGVRTLFPNFQIP